MIKSVAFVAGLFLLYYGVGIYYLYQAGILKHALKDMGIMSVMLVPMLSFNCAERVAFHNEDPTEYTLSLFTGERL